MYYVENSFDLHEPPTVHAIHPRQIEPVFRAMRDAIGGMDRLREWRERVEVEAREPLEKEIAAVRGENESLRDILEEASQPFMDWTRQQEDAALHAARMGTHFFIQPPREEEVSACVRCLQVFPDAGQGCIEYMRDKYNASQGENASLRKEIAALHDLLGQAWALLDPEEHPELCELLARNTCHTHWKEARRV